MEHLMKNYTQTKIAELLCVNKSTISREINRNSTTEYYSVENAHIKAVSPDQIVEKKIRFGDFEVDTITSDNGQEFSYHEKNSKLLHTKWDIFQGSLKEHWFRLVLLYFINVKLDKYMVRMKGLEPSRRKAPDPKSGVYTNFTTSAYDYFLKV